jgi:hypothetical protein
MNLGNLIRITNFYSIHKSIQWLIDDFERNYKENRDWINQNKANIEISINNLKSAEQKKEYKDNDPDYQNINIQRYYSDYQMMNYSKNLLLNHFKYLDIGFSIKYQNGSV